MSRLLIAGRPCVVSLVLVIIFSIPDHCLAQSGGWQSVYQSNTNISLTPPSPTAASFQRFAITPISYNSGLPNISIPVYEVKAGDLEMPITLSYHYNGLKPREEASWVGMGWNLSAGGCITRMKRGATDGSRYAGNNYDNINPVDSVNNYGSGSAPWPFKTFLYATFYNQTYDTEPDIFVFNFMGHQGKFLVVRGKAYFIEFERWKVTKLSNDAGFFITDENGTQYLFSVLEMTSAKKASQNDPLEPEGYVSAWYLTRVTSADQQHWMSFGYTPYTYNDQGGIVSQHYKITFFEALANYACNIVGDYATAPVLNNAPTGNTIAGNTLSTITTSANQTIKLIQSSQTRRDEFTTEGALAQVVVYGQTGNPDTVIKRTAFHYGYFGDSTTQVNSWLKLSAVSELSGTGDTLNQYSFEYQNEFGKFPPKTSLGVDQWGYYNGGGDDPTTGGLLPQEAIQTATLGVYPTTFSPYSNINPNNQYCQYGVISKVHYPTGGYTQYSYEQNKYVPGVQSSPMIYEQQTATNTLVNTPPPPPGGSPTFAGQFTIPNSGNPGQAPQKAYIYYDRVLYSAYTDPKKEFNVPLIIDQLIAGSCSDTTGSPPCRFDTLYSGPALYTTDNRSDSIMLGPGTYNYIQQAGTADSTSQTGQLSVTISIVVPETDKNIDPGMKNQQGNTLSSNPTWLAVFHELGGHGYLKYDQHDPSQGGHTIDYENKIRSFHGMELRSYDGAHAKPKDQDNN